MEMKKCSKCGEIKPFTSEYFVVRKEARSGLRGTCKDCVNEKGKKYYLMKSCCKQCEQCAYYWENTDTENECDGEDEICHEFIEFKGIGH